MALILLIMASLLVSKVNGQVCPKTSSISSYSKIGSPEVACDVTSSHSKVERSTASCASSCMAAKDCLFFSYNKTTQLCVLCTDLADGNVAGVEASSSGRYYGLSQSLRVTDLASPLNVNLTLPCGVTTGNMIVLRGVYIDYKDFSLNLVQDANNTHLHYNVRWTRDTVFILVLNSKTNGIWMSEQFPDGTNYPFLSGNEFTLIIVVKSDRYTVFINGKFVCDFSFRTPLTGINYLELFATIRLIELSL